MGKRPAILTGSDKTAGSIVAWITWIYCSTQIFFYSALLFTHDDAFMPRSRRQRHGTARLWQNDAPGITIEWCMDAELRRVALAGGAGDAGDGEGGVNQPVVLCVPGAMCPPEVYAAMATASGRRVAGLAWLEGAGPHDLPSVAQRVADVAAEFPSVVLVGHSIGTPIAVLAASLSAARGASTIRGLVLSNSGANTKGHGDIDSIIRTVAQQWGAPLWQAFVARCLGSPVAPGLLERMHGYPAQLTSAAVVAALTSQKEIDLLPALGALGHLPAAMVHGRHDPARTLAHAEELVAGLPGATLHVLETGHSSAAEAPDAFAAILNGVISRCHHT